MKLKDQLESLAKDTWERLRDSRSLGIRFGEETITDLLLLEMKRKSHPRSYIVQTPLVKEKNQGTDWEWWIGSARIGWLRYAIQAKRCDKASGRYTSITHKVAGIAQNQILKTYAERNDAIPIYCFYNYPLSGMTTKAWQCGLPFDKYQLACTVTSLGVVEAAISKWGGKNFDWIHSQTASKPWRCLVACPRILTAHVKANIGSGNSMNPEPICHPLTDAPITIHKTLPKELTDARETGRVEQFSAERYDAELARYPRRILVLETDQSEERVTSDV